MNEHTHEWRWHSEHGEDGIDCRLCDEEYGYRPENWMDKDEVIRRLNATERLSAEDSTLLANSQSRLQRTPMSERLAIAARTYANILEGK